MKSILLSSVAGAGLVLFSLSAVAQDRGRDDDSYRRSAMPVLTTNTGVGVCSTTCGKTFNMCSPRPGPRAGTSIV